MGNLELWLESQQQNDDGGNGPNRASITNEPNLHSSYTGRFLAAWASTFSLELRLLEGRGKFVLGALIDAAALATFVTLFALALTNYHETTYMSLTYTEYSSSSFDRSTTECSTVPLSVSSTIYADENGAWSTDSTNYNSLKMLKEVTFTNFEGDESYFDQAIEELNSCIDDINDYASNHSFMSNLLYMGFTECQAANESLSVSFPMAWNYIYDFSLYSVESNLVLPNDLSWNNVVRGQNNLSSFSGEISMRVDTNIELQITCAANYTLFSPMPGQDYCGLLYKNLYNETEVVTEEKEVSIQLELDSIARCIAINKKIVDVNYFDDLLVISSSVSSKYNVTQYYAYLQDADDPTLMFITPAWSYCVLVYQDSLQTVKYFPIIEYTDDKCHSIFGPVSDSCSKFEKQGCESEFASDLVLWIYNEDLTTNYGAIRISAEASRQVVNSNLYYFEEAANLSCKPLLSHLPNSSQQAVPVDLINDYYKCTTRAAESYSGALSEAWANTQLVLVCVAMLISTVLLRFCGAKLGQTMDYDGGEVAIAQLELALARVEEKKQLKLSPKAPSMRGLLPQDVEEGGGEALASSMSDFRLAPSGPEETKGEPAPPGSDILQKMNRKEFKSSSGIGRSTSPGSRARGRSPAKEGAGEGTGMAAQVAELAAQLAEVRAKLAVLMAARGTPSDAGASSTSVFLPPVG